ncbi:MAG: MBL fold metallo-hydrolase, partial [Candidatus Limnocylindria bacterium]
MSAPERISEHLHRLSDTCNVYLVQDGRSGLLVDFGSGIALDQVDDLGVDEISRVLVTHHHRDQVQGLKRAVDAGIEIWVPPVEQGLIADVDAH